MAKSQPADHEAVDENKVPRRTFLKGTAAVVGAAAVGASCQQEEAAQQVGPSSVDAPLRSPQPPVSPAPLGILAFFTRHEYQTVEAMTERIYPFEDGSPGARAAGAANYIDKVLAAYDGFAQPTYTQGPYLATYEGSAPPADRPDVVFVPKDEADRYGFQSRLSPQEIYRLGLESLDQRARNEQGHEFAMLELAQQDEILRTLEDDEAGEFEEPSGATFFGLVRRHTIEGMFGDPLYGGNRNKMGWKAIGYPGAWRAYNPRDLRTEGFRADDPVSLLEAPHFHPGEPVGDHVVLPVQGTERRIRRVPRGKS